MITIPLTLRLVKGSKLTFLELDQNFLSLRNAINTTISSDTFVTGGTYNQSTVNLDFVGNGGFNPFSVNVQGLTDTYVSGGVYSASTGCVTFSTTSGYTFDVCGFLTGSTIWTNGSSGNYSLKTINDSGLDATGDYALAEGYNTLASGLSSHAEGSGTIASGIISHAGGIASVASGLTSFIHSTNSLVTGDRSVVLGGQNITGTTDDTVYVPYLNIGTLGTGTSINNLGIDISGFVVVGTTGAPAFTGNTSGDCITDLYITNLYGCSPVTVHDSLQHITSSGTGMNSIAWGFQTLASGDYSHAEGKGTTASGSRSHAEGGNTTASGNWSHAEGSETIASGIWSHAEGNSTLASGTTSHAEGYGTTASGNYSHAEGYGTTASGNYSHAEGFSTTASGDYSHAEGGGGKFGLTASGLYSHAEGLETKAIGIASHAEGGNTTASGYYSHAGGFRTIATGNTSHAEGNNTTASGDYSHSEGKGTTASGNYGSSASGYYTTASGNYGSHAEGDNTTASGYGSHSEGKGTIASGDYSHAEGYGGKSGSIASGIASHAGGIASVASGETSFIHSTNSLVTGDRSVVLGGQNITGTTEDTVYVPNLNIGTLSIVTTGTTIIDNLGIESSGLVVKSYTTKRLEIGDWDMTATTQVTVAHGLSTTEWKTMLESNVLIRNDSDTVYSPLKSLFGPSSGLMNGGVSVIDSTNITLGRYTTGGFDDGTFTSTPYNRGWVTFDYIKD